MWLDKLPTDVCERIAAHASHGQQTDAALVLAESSLRMRDAILTSLSYKLRLFADDVAHSTHRWMKFAPQCKTLHFSNLDSTVKRTAVVLDRSKKKKRCVSVWDAVLSQGTIEFVSFWVSPYILQELKNNRTVKKLTIKSVGSQYAQMLFETLTTMDVREVTFVCEARDINMCLLANQTYFNSKHNALAQACPNLHTLEIACGCTAWQYGAILTSQCAHRIWTIFPACKSLKYLKLPMYPPQDVIQDVCNLESVEPQCDELAFELAIRLENAATVLRCIRYLSPIEISRLSVCTRLSVVDIQIREGTESFLPKLVCNLPLLKSLCVRMPMKRDATSQQFQLAQAIPGSIFQTVQHAPNLDTLHIVDTYISSVEVQDILTHFASKLRGFFISISNQDEPVLPRLEALLYMAARYNCELRSLAVSLRLDISMENLDDLIYQAARVYRALDCLQGRAPYLDPRPLERLFRMHGLARVRTADRRDDPQQLDLVDGVWNGVEIRGDGQTAEMVHDNNMFFHKPDR